MEVFASTDLTGEPVAHHHLRTARAHVARRVHRSPSTRARFSARLRGTVRVDETGDWTFGLTATGACRVTARRRAAPRRVGRHRAGHVVLRVRQRGDPRHRAHLRPARTTTLEIEFSGGSAAMVSGLELGAAPPTPTDAHRADAATAARRAPTSRSSWSGTGPTLDTEGKDRPIDGRSPANRTRSCARSSPRTRGRSSCVNAGSPVTMDWADDRARDAAVLAARRGVGQRARRRAARRSRTGRTAAHHASRCGSRTPPRTPPIPAPTATSPTPTGSSWATAATTAPVPIRASASATASRTPRSSTARSVDGRRGRASTVTNTGAARRHRGRAALRRTARRRPRRGPSRSCAASPRWRSPPGRRAPSSFDLDDRCFSEWHDGWTDARGPVRDPHRSLVARHPRDGARSHRDLAALRCGVRQPREPHMAVTAYLLIQTEVGKTAGVVDGDPRRSTASSRPTPSPAPTT